MSEGKNRRIVKKSKNIDKMNIKVSTADKDVLIKDKKFNLNLEGQKKNKSTKIGKESNIEARIAKLIEINNKSLYDIDTIQSTINVNEEKVLSEIKTLNQQLSTLEKEQIQASKKNKNLINHLKGMEEEINKKFNAKFKISKILKKHKKTDSKRDINIEIKSKEEQTKMMQIIVENDIKRLDKLLDNYGEGTEKKLQDELNEINDKISVLQKEIVELNKIKMAHNLCTKNGNSLKTKLNVLCNEYEFESKKSNIILTERKERNKIRNINMTMRYGEILRKNFLKNIKNKYNSRIKLVNYRPYNFMMNEFKESKKSLVSSYRNLKEKNLKTMRNSDIPNFSTYLKTQISHRIDTKGPQVCLFTEQEKEVLKKLLPKECINSFNEKYDKIEKKLTKIKEKFKGNEQMKNKIYLDNINLEEINLKKKELSHIKANLLGLVIKNNKKILEFKKKIQSLNNKIQKEDAILSHKDKNNILLKKRIDVLKKNKNIQAG